MQKKHVKASELDVAGGLAVESICEAADAHAADNNDPEYAVGDLQLVLGEAFKRLSPEARDEVVDRAREIIGADFFPAVAR